MSSPHTGRQPATRHVRIAATALDDRAVARIVQEFEAVAGLDATICSGHSLRAGFATSAAMHGAEGGGLHGSRGTGHPGYIRDGKVFARNASHEIGL